MPIRVALEVIPRGDETKKFAAGTLEIENDGTGACNLSGGGLGRRGWWSLVKEVLGTAKTDYESPATDEQATDSGPRLFGHAWPATKDHSPIWWLAAESIVDSADSTPCGQDPRLWVAEAWPDLHPGAG